jgi:hypothetical protein
MVGFWPKMENAQWRAHEWSTVAGHAWEEALGRKWKNGYRYPSFQNLNFFIFFKKIKSEKAISM